MSTTYSQPWSLPPDGPRAIRVRTFPRQVQAIPHLDYYGECRPTSERGGNFLDFVPLDGGALSLCVGNVAANSMAAAVTMSGMQSFLRSLSSQQRGSPGSIVNQINRIVYDAAPEDFSATLFYARVDPVERELRYVNARHDTALMVRKVTGRPLRFESTGTVLGLSRRVCWDERRLPLEPGDLIVAFTEGLELGEQDVLRAVEENPDARASTLVARIMELAGGFAGLASADRTVLAVRVTGDEERALELEDEELVSLAVA